MIQFFGVHIDPINRIEVLDLLKSPLNSNKNYFITTLNPEILLIANRNKSYREVLAKSDLGLIDGFGLLLMLRIKGVKTERFTGVEMVIELARMCAREGKKMMLIGGKNTEQAVKVLNEKYDGLQITSTLGVAISDVGIEIAGDCHGRKPRNDVIEYAPDVLLVGFGAPKQELWISKHKHEFPSVRIVAGVGGAFDMIAGVKPRAPFIFRRLGLEWLWRFFLEPKRIGRIFRAVVVFPIKAIFEKVTYN